MQQQQQQQIQQHHQQQQHQLNERQPEIPVVPSTSKQSMDDKATQTTSQQLSIRDQNQEFLLSIPSLLFRLVNLVRRKDYTIRFNGANSEIENWIRYKF